MKKQIISGFLSALVAFGFLQGCSKTQEKANNEKNLYTIELPIEKEITEAENEKLKANLEAKIIEFNYENKGIEIKLDLGLSIRDFAECKVNYELLNEIIELYSKIDEDYKRIYYAPINIYNIDFNYVNLKNIDTNIYITHSGIKLENIIPVIKSIPNPSLDINYSINLNKDDIPILLDLIELISEKNGSLDISTYGMYKKDELCELMLGINKKWHFNSFSFTSYDDFTAYTSNINTERLYLNIYSDNVNLEYKINDGTRFFDIRFYNDLNVGKNIHLEIPDSLETLEIDYDKIDSLSIEDIKNASLNIRTEDAEKISTFIKLGYLEYPEFNIKAGNYRLEKDIFTDYKIELEQDDEYIGEVKLQKDKDGNITGLIVITEGKNDSMLLSRKKNY